MQRGIETSRSQLRVEDITVENLATVCDTAIATRVWTLQLRNTNVYHGGSLALDNPREGLMTMLVLCDMDEGAYIQAAVEVIFVGAGNMQQKSVSASLKLFRVRPLALVTISAIM